MIRINASNLMGDAWMLKAKGQSYEAIPVDIHIYGEPGNLEANVKVALWMLKYDPYDKLKDFLRSYVGYLACNEVGYTDNDEEFRSRLKICLNSLPYNLGELVGWSDQETATYLMNLASNLSVDEIYDMGDSVDMFSGDFVAHDLNEDFIRVRMNDEYNAGAYNGVCYFRIGSTYKNWVNQIWAFVHDHGKIKTVVVERDAESDDNVSDDYRDVYIDNMSREEFLSSDRLPFLGSRSIAGLTKACYDILCDGRYSDLDRVRANANRVFNAYKALRREHIKLNCKTIKAPWATKPRNR